METIAVSEVPFRRAARNFQILRIAAAIPVERLKADVQAARKIFPPIEKDGYRLYSGIGLQYQDPSNPIYDAVQQCRFFAADGSVSIYRPHDENEFLHNNEIGLKLQYLHELFQCISLFRGRILVAQPGSVLGPHRDGEDSVRIHIPITTNEKCYVQIDETKFYLPADGSAYLCNTSLLHSAGNLGSEERIHIVFAV